MKMPWNKDELGRELRAARPTPPAELENALESEIRGRRRSRSGAPRLRFGLAAATTAVVVLSFTAVGGMAAASSSVRHAFTNVAQVVHLSSSSRRAHATAAASPAVDQYGRKKSCVKSAYDRRRAALRAANAKLNRDLAKAGKNYKQRAASARKLAAAKQKNAALHAAYAKYLAARKAAAKRHAAAVTKANARYKADTKKCPAV
jgi:hypothetical protein